MSKLGDEFWEARRELTETARLTACLREMTEALNFRWDEDGLLVRVVRPAGPLADDGGRFQVEVGFSLLCRDWSTLEGSEAWEALDRFVRTLQTTGKLLPLQIQVERGETHGTRVQRDTRGSCESNHDADAGIRTARV